MVVVELIEVHLWGKLIGALAQQGSQVNFSYENNFQRSRIEIAPLLMPLGSDIYSFPRLSQETFKGLPPTIADSLPDRYGTALIQRWLTLNGRTPDTITPLERLAYMGNRGMGALEYRPAMHTKKQHAEKIEISSLVEIANEILRQRDQVQVEFGEDEKVMRESLQQLITVGTSAGGARAKAVIAYNPSSKEVRSGQVNAPSGFIHYLLKFDGFASQNAEEANPTGFGAIEYVYHLMARKSGITMMNCDLLGENGRRHFMTQRFDRIENKKVHTQTLCAMANVDYNAQRIYGYENLFAIVDQLNFPHPQKVELFLRMIFNVMARNHDDHTKNFAFTMDQQGIWQLSPAYDICYSYSSNRASWVHLHQMTINGKAENFTLDDFEPIAKRYGIKKWKNLVVKVKDALDDWEELASLYGVPEFMVAEIKGNFRRLER